MFARLRRMCAAVFAAAVAACAPGDADDARLVLADLQAGPGPSALKRLTPAPERSVVRWQHAGEAQEGDLYVVPGLPPRAAIVLVPGLAPDGRRDARLVDFAGTLARVSFAVLVPELPGFRAQRVSASDGDRIAAAVDHVLGRPEGRGPVGLAAVSYAVGPAVLAALDPALAGRVAFVLGIGGYYDLRAVVTYFTTGFYREADGGGWQRAEPNAYGKWLFVLANAERVASPRDRVALATMARRKLVDAAADVADLERGLGPEGQAVVALLANRDPDRAATLIDALPQAIRADLDSLDLRRRDLSALAARFILVHGRDDAIIPHTQSRALARALPEGQAHLAVLDGLAHADLGPAGIADGIRLWRAAYALMRERGPPLPAALP